MLTKEAFVDLIHAMGSDRVLFGTDSPWSGQKDAVQWFMENKNANNIKNKRKPCTAGAENVFGLFES